MRGPKVLYEKQQDLYTEKTMYSFGFAACVRVKNAGDAALGKMISCQLNTTTDYLAVMWKHPCFTSYLI